MTTFLDRWNLQPQERRLVVVVAAILFGLLNLWFVWPHFKDWQQVKDAREQSRRKLGRYTNEVAHVPEYDRRLKVLEKLGSPVIPSEQTLDFYRSVEKVARLKGVRVDQQGQPTPVKDKETGNTNSFFEKLSLTIRVTTGESELVDFLYELGEHNSMIRVGDMRVNPAPGANPTNLSGHITLVASYQKTNASKPNVAAKASTPPAPKLAASATSKMSTNSAGAVSPNKSSSLFPKISAKGSTNIVMKGSTNQAAKAPATNAKKL
ncbi:MAG: GspMb/PilO family protein [Verrucomicrobiota bacterium]